MSLVTTRGRSHHGVEVVVRRRLRFLRVEHGDALHFFVPDTFFQQLRLNKQFVAHPSAMASAIVAMIAANRLLTPLFVSRKDNRRELRSGSRKNAACRLKSLQRPSKRGWMA